MNFFSNYIFQFNWWINLQSLFQQPTQMNFSFEDSGPGYNFNFYLCLHENGEYTFKLDGSYMIESGTKDCSETKKAIQVFLFEIKNFLVIVWLNF
jgi:hypothetical protein